MNTPMLQLKEVKKYFPIRSGFWQRTEKNVHAVDGVDLSVNRGDILGIVGETGCGKSTLAQLIMGIYAPTAGRILLNGKDINEKSKDLLAMKRKVQIVFQDPFWSLNPRKRIRKILEEPFKVHHMADQNRLKEKTKELFEMVGLSANRLDSYPHEFAGGERQLIGIARAIALQPDLVLLDEPTSAIDTFSQAGILNLLIELRDRFNLSYILISHDLSVIHFLCDRIAVMYLGKIVESGLIKDVFEKTLHPYTRALLAAIPVIDASGEVRPIYPIEGEIPSAIDPAPGCRFAGRCPMAQNICRTDEPRLRMTDQSGDQHLVACHFTER